MSWRDLEDNANLIALSTFGEATPVVYTPQGGSPVSITGIFTESYEDATYRGGLPVSTERPIVDLRVADLPQMPAQRDAVTINGLNYTVSDVRPGGHGTVMLLLRST